MQTISDTRTLGAKSHEDLQALGVTYRQLDYWTRVGYIHPDITSPGSGRRRQWTDAELFIAQRIGVLLRCGIVLDVAARIARETGQSWHMLDETRSIYLCEGFPGLEEASRA